MNIIWKVEIPINTEFKINDDPIICIPNNSSNRCKNCTFNNTIIGKGNIYSEDPSMGCEVFSCWDIDRSDNTTVIFKRK